MTNEKNLPLPLVKACQRSVSNCFTPVDLAHGAREAVLVHWHPDEYDASDVLWGVAEKALETLGRTDVEIDVGGITLSAYCNYYDEKEKCIYFYKFANPSIAEKVPLDWRLIASITAWAFKEYNMRVERCRFVLFVKKPIYEKNSIKVVDVELEDVSDFVKQKAEAIAHCMQDEVMPKCSAKDKWADTEYKVSLLINGKPKEIGGFKSKGQAEKFAKQKGGRVVECIAEKGRRCSKYCRCKVACAKME